MGLYKTPVCLEPRKGWREYPPPGRMKSQEFNWRFSSSRRIRISEKTLHEKHVAMEMRSQKKNDCQKITGNVIGLHDDINQTNKGALLNEFWRRFSSAILVGSLDCLTIRLTVDFNFFVFPFEAKKNCAKCAYISPTFVDAVHNSGKVTLEMMRVMMFCGGVLRHLFPNDKFV